MSRFFRNLYTLAILLVLWSIMAFSTGCCQPRGCCPPPQCCQPCAPACMPHACCPQPVCPRYFPLNPGHYSEPMHPYVTEMGEPALIPQSGLKSLMNATP